MMRAAILTTIAAADALITDLNIALGYPKDGTNVAPGPHAPAAQSRTTSWALPLRHAIDPTRYAVVFKDRLMLLTTAAAEARIVPSVLTKAQYDALKAKLLTSEELAADWFPAGGA